MTAALTTRNRRVGVIATPATVRSHAYFAAIKDENPAVEVYEHATPAFVPLVEAGLLSGSGGRGDRRRGTRTAARRARRVPASSSSRCRHRPGSTRCCSVAPTTRCCGRSSRRSPATRVAIVDSATATASALSELLAINGLEAPDAPGARAGPRPATTGDIDAFRSVAGRLFGAPSSTSSRSSSRRWRRERSARRSGDWPRAGRPGATTGCGRPGFIVGSALGAAATVLGRRAENVARRGLVDWSRAERIATDRLRSAPGTPDGRGAPGDRSRLRGGDGQDRARDCRRRSGRSCRASSSDLASSIGPAGSTPTSRRSRR